MTRFSGRPAATDTLDYLCREWGVTRRQLLGIDEPLKAHEFVGPLRSTLGRRRDLPTGAKGEQHERRYPEVYLGEAVRVNAAFHRLPVPLQTIMDLHYVCRAPVRFKIEAVGVSRRTYYTQVSQVRAHVQGYILAR